MITAWAIVATLFCLTWEREHHKPVWPRWSNVAKVVVSSVWAVHQQRYCGRAVVQSIQAALRALQTTPVHNTSHCMSLDQARFLAQAGCGNNTHAEIIRFARPALFIAPHPMNNSRVAGLIAYTRDDEPGWLMLGFGYRARQPGRASEIFYATSWSYSDFLRLAGGECSTAVAPEAVPDSI